MTLVKDGKADCIQGKLLWGEKLESTLTRTSRDLLGLVNRLGDSGWRATKRSIRSKGDSCLLHATEFLLKIGRSD